MCVYEAIDSVRVNENFTHEQAKKAEKQLEHIGIPKRIRISKRLELRQGAKVMMLKNMEIMVGDSETVKLVNGSQGGCDQDGERKADVTGTQGAI